MWLCTPEEDQRMDWFKIVLKTEKNRLTLGIL